jgi:biopolymer transport protein ExbB
VLGILLVLSVASWYLIVTRALANTLAQRRADAFVKQFWQAPYLTEAAEPARQRPATTPLPSWSSVARCFWPRHHDSLAAAGGMGEYLTRTLGNEVDQEAAASNTA